MSKIELHNGDCMEYMKNIPDKSIDLVITDPPYDLKTSGAGMYKQERRRYVKSLEQMSNGFSPDVLDELCRVMKKINIYLFCSQKQIVPLLDYFVKQRKCNYNIISWHKTNPVPACSNKYLTDTEFILFFRETGVRVYGEYATKRTWYATPLNKADKDKYNHPTVKPLEILENLVVNSSNDGDIVLDPFMGSGSTGEACVRHNRGFIGIEIVKEYFDTATRRVFSSIEESKTCDDDNLYGQQQGLF